MGSTPGWRRVFDSVERAIGVPLENLVATREFTEAMAVGIKMRRTAEEVVRRVVYGVSGTVLHAVNIPTGDDVRRLSANLTTLAGEIRALERAQRADTVTADPASTSAATKRATTRTGSNGSGHRRG